MLVTLLGIVKEVKEEQRKNAPSPMLVTLLGISVLWQPAMIVLVAVSIIALQFSRLSYAEFLLSTTMEVRDWQSEKAPSPILVTLSPIVIEVRELQCSNAQSPMLVTLLGIVTEVKEEQTENVKSPMFVTLLGIIMEVRDSQL